MWALNKKVWEAFGESLITVERNANSIFYIDIYIMYIGYSIYFLCFILICIIYIFYNIL